MTKARGTVRKLRGLEAAMGAALGAILGTESVRWVGRCQACGQRVMAHSHPLALKRLCRHLYDMHPRGMLGLLKGFRPT